MVFGQKGPRDDIERSRAHDMGGTQFKDLPAVLQEVMVMLNEARQMLDDRSVAFHDRMSKAVAKADEAVAAFPESPHALIFRGNLGFQNLNYHYARLDFEKFNELFPTEIAILPVLARIAMESGDFEHASGLIEEVLRTDPNDPQILTLISELLEKQDRPKDAAALLGTLLTGLKLKESAAIRNAIAKLLLDAENPEGALEILQPLYNESIQDSESYRLYGDVRAELGHPDDARDAYLTALNLDPGNMKAHYNLGLTLRELGQRERAKSELEIVSTTNPNDADAHFQLFEIALERDEEDDALQYALQYLLNAEELEDDDPALAYVTEYDGEFSHREILDYCKYLIDNGDADQAIELLEPNVNDPDVSPPFEVLMGTVMIELDRTAEALKWTEKALDHYEEDYEGFIVCCHAHPPDEADGGEFTELVCREAELHISLGDFNKAEEALEELGEDDSLAHIVFRVRGEIAFIKGDFEEALSQFHNALYEYPADVDSLASLAATYKKAGNPDAAINYYLRAHIIDNKDIPILRSLIELYVEMGFKREATVFIAKYGDIEDDDQGRQWAERQLLKLG